MDIYSTGVESIRPEWNLSDRNDIYSAGVLVMYGQISLRVKYIERTVTIDVVDQSMFSI